MFAKPQNISQRFVQKLTFSLTLLLIPQNGKLQYFVERPYWQCLCTCNNELLFNYDLIHQQDTGNYLSPCPCLCSSPCSCRGRGRCRFRFVCRGICKCRCRCRCRCSWRDARDAVVDVNVVVESDIDVDVFSHVPYHSFFALVLNICSYSTCMKCMNLTCSCSSTSSFSCSCSYWCSWMCSCLLSSLCTYVKYSFLHFFILLLIYWKQHFSTIFVRVRNLN